MTGRFGRVLALGGAVITAACAVACVVMVALMPAAGGTSSVAQSLLFLGLFVPLMLALSTMGLLVVWRSAGHPIGWLMSAAGFLVGASFAGSIYASLSLAQPGAGLPGAAVAAWFGAWATTLGLSMLGIFVPLLFPSGRLLSERWRRPCLVLVAVITIGTLAAALTPGPLGGGADYDNPFGLVAAGDALGLIGTVFNLAAPIAFGTGLLALVLRYRRGSTSERQQIKLFAYPASIAVVALLISISDLLGLGDAAWEVALLALTGIPIAIAVAIVRHGLFDIDRLISRTVAYLVVTALLVGLYAAVVLATEPLVAAVTGGTELAVAAATLAAAAVFQPLRRRVQTLVDRRFDRARYDTEATVAAFAATLRTEVTLEAVRDDLVGTVRRTVHPADAALWLREGPRAS